MSATITDPAIHLRFNSDLTDESDNDVGVSLTGTEAYEAGKFGNALTLDGGTYLSFPNNANFTVGTGDFTWIFWFKSNVANNDKFFISGRGAWGTFHLTTGGYGGTVAGTLRYVGSLTIAGTTVLNDDVWHHIAIVRKNTAVTLYVDGVSDATGTDTTDYNNSAGTWYISRNDFSAVGQITGAMDELIFAPYAVYESEFTPPTTAYNDSTILPIECNTSWKIFNLENQHLAWKILSKLDKNLAWKILSKLDKNLAWKIVAEITNDASWRILTGSNRDVAWQILGSTEASTSWAIINRLSQDVSWRILRQALLSQDLAWKIFNETDRDLVWQILNSTELSQQIAWKILAKKDVVTAWKILAKKDVVTAWKIRVTGSQDVAWKIMTDMDVPSAWKIKAVESKDTAWKVLNSFNQDLSWKILKVADSDLAWKIFNELSKNTSWVIGNLPDPLYEFFQPERSYIFNQEKRTLIFYQKER